MDKSKLLVINLISEDRRSHVEIGLLYDDGDNYVGFPTNSNLADPLIFPKYAWEIQRNDNANI